MAADRAHIVGSHFTSAATTGSAPNLPSLPLDGRQAVRGPNRVGRGRNGGKEAAGEGWTCGMCWFLFPLFSSLPTLLIELAQV